MDLIYGSLVVLIYIFLVFISLIFDEVLPWLVIFNALISVLTKVFYHLAVPC